MGGLTILEQMCGVTMILAALGCVLMLYAGLALERQRQALADLHGHCLRLTFQRQAADWRYQALRGHLLALALSRDFDPVVVI